MSVIKNNVTEEAPGPIEQLLKLSFSLNDIVSQLESTVAVTP